jgi:hypothetical protein
MSVSIALICAYINEFSDNWGHLKRIREAVGDTPRHFDEPLNNGEVWLF